MSKILQTLLTVTPEMWAFLQQIKEDPTNLTQRLIFADYLEEGDDPRGPLMRLQCEMASLPMGDPKRGKIEQSEQALLQPLRVWFKPRPAWLISWEFQLGLLKLEVRLSKDLAQGLNELSECNWWP